MFGSHRSWLARYIGPLLVYLGVFPYFFRNSSACSDSAYISSLVVSLRCVVCPRYLNSVTFSIFADLLVCLRCPHGLSCTLSFLYVFLSQLSGFLRLNCSGVFSICFVVSLKRATSSGNLKLVRFSPSTLTPSEMSTFLNTFSMTVVNN